MIRNPTLHTSQEMDNSSFDESLGVNMVELIGADGTLQNLAGMNIPTHDYIGVTYPLATTEVYTYKTGGSVGATVATITVLYTTSAKDVLTSVTKS